MIKFLLASLTVLLFNMPVSALADCVNACNAGYNTCVSRCPFSVHDNASGNDLTNTDAQDQCRDACSAGENTCELEC